MTERHSGIYDKVVQPLTSSEIASESIKQFMTTSVQFMRLFSFKTCACNSQQRHRTLFKGITGKSDLNPQ